ncbi:MAG: hypothetical protein GY774_24525, partial [Planctomycetes bacterium]|nr:hypothetical protein [Planctomycetota bacterium]
MKLIRFLFAFLVISGLLSAKPARAEWEFHLAPYIWASSLNGSVQAGPLSADIDADFSDLVSALDIGGSLHFEAQQRPWGFFGDFMYVKLSDEENLPAGTIDGEVRSGIYEGGVLRQVTGS